MITLELNDRKHLKQLRTSLDTAIAMVAEEYGISGAVKSAKFERDGSNVSFNIDFNRVGENGIVDTKERQAFKVYAEIEGMKEEWLDKTFIHPHHGTFTIQGYKDRSPKFPVIYNIVGKGGYKSTVRAIIQMVNSSKEK